MQLVAIGALWFLSTLGPAADPAPLAAPPAALLPATHAAAPARASHLGLVRRGEDRPAPAPAPLRLRRGPALEKEESGESLFSIWNPIDTFRPPGSAGPRSPELLPLASAALALRTTIIRC